MSLSCQLLEQSDTGKLHVCDIFRWQDLWSRNPDSGFGPSLVLAGKLNGAARDLLIDMNRCERASSAALKTTGDASQGGSVEGVTWLSDHLRRYKPEA